eukprot:scaffold182179_cov36-Tisochrysis_lutea.AAC.1
MPAAIDQSDEYPGPVHADDVGLPDPYDDDEADQVIIRGDYKKQFSAERTTNQWILLGLKSGGIALGLLAAGQYEPPIKVAGLLLMVPSIFCAFWGGLQYRRRTLNIETLSKDSLASFEDRIGSTVVVLSLSIAVLANAVLGLKRYMSDASLFTA